jgi:glycosyltransferase involved in cell wall biosynthesis
MSAPTREIMYVTTSLDGGGAERLLTNIVLQPNVRDRISVVSLLPGGVFRSTLEDAGIEVTDLGVRRRVDALPGLFRLAALIHARRPAVVHGWLYHGNLMAFMAAILARHPRTALFWGTFCTEGQGDPWTVRLLRRMNVLLSRFVAGVVYNAEEARDFHRRIGFREPRSIVISNCIDPEVFRHDPKKREALRAELGIGDDEIIVAVVARVDPMKDWRAVRDAVRDVPGIVTVAIGTGTDQLPAQSRFIGLGWRDDVVRILSAADIFLLGSAFGEGTSLALGEAMLCGLPCVVTDVGGNSSLIGEAGIVVEPKDVAAMREAVAQLARDREQRRALGRAAYARAMALPSPEHTLGLLRLLTVTAEASP